MLAALVCTTLAMAGAPTEVELRAGADPIRAEIETVDLRGLVTAEDAEGRRRVIAWDRVRGVTGPAAAECAGFAEDADDAWRARTRIERGDWDGAEALLIGLFDRYRGIGGPTASMVAEGTLRTRLRRVEIAGAFEAWIELVRTRLERPRGESWVGGEIRAGAPVIDPSTLLAPELAPIFIAPRDARVVDDAAGGFEATDPVARSLASIYAFAAGPGEGAPVIEQEAASHPGVILASAVALGASVDAASRVSARELLEARLENGELPRWQEAWCRVALGRSLALESDEQARLMGVLHMLHVPARLGADHAYLAGVALHESARVLDELGDGVGASRLRDELVLRFPAHPLVINKIPGAPVAPDEPSGDLP